MARHSESSRLRFAFDRAVGRSNWRSRIAAAGSSQAVPSRSRARCHARTRRAARRNTHGGERPRRRHTRPADRAAEGAQRGRMSGRVTVLLADDHHLVRRGFQLLEDDARLEVVGEAADGEEAVRLATELRPRVVVMTRRCRG